MDISIRKFQEKDIENKIKWINDSSNNKYLHYELPLEYSKTLNWFHRIKDRTDRYDAVIEADNIPVGLIGLLSIDENNKKAEYYIVLGDTRFKGKGIAHRASKLILEYGFEKLDLNKIYLYTERENIKAQRLFEKVGFIKEGLLKEDIRNGHELVDRYVYGICKEDFYNKEYEKSNPFNPTHIIRSNIDINSNKLYIKRDDLIPISFGGNKARKAVFFFKDIERTKADCIVTYGSSSSNHCRIVANIAASKGLPCYIISPSEDDKSTANRKLVRLFGANIINCPVPEVSNTIDATLEKLKLEGHNPYFIQGGGHGDLGTRAYVLAYEEILQFERQKGIFFDYIFHASGTGTTQAGLVCGKVIYDDNRSIVGISIARQNPYGGNVVLDSVNSYLTSINRGNIDRKDIDFIDDYTLHGYGQYNDKILDTIDQVLIKDGIPLDTTYTGKAFWGMKEYIVENQITDKNILFIHTGGTPLFFDDLEVLTNEE